MVRTLFLLLLLLSGLQVGASQTTSELAREVTDLKQKVAALEQRLDLVISLLNRQGGQPSAASLVPPTTPVPAPAATLRPSTPSPAPAASASRVQCQATTKKGTQCLRLASAGASHCWQHGR